MNGLEFINKCQSKHNNKYFYENMDNVRMKGKIKIICPIHGTFSQMGSKHIKGQGCPKCAYESNKISQEEFIERSNKLHNYRYDYSLVNYINSQIKIKIICKEHGVFEQTPNNHTHILNKRGCPKCNNGIRYTKDELLNLFDKKHGNKYGYELFDYDSMVNTYSKIKIVCKEHGSFEQSVAAHIKGQRCKKCQIDNQKYTHEEFVEKSKNIHGNKYKIISKYISSTSQLEILCNNCHDTFLQKPKNHLYGSGCPKCCSSSISKIEIKWLDSINIPIENRHKTINILNKYYLTDAFDPSTNTIYEFYGDFWHGNPKIYKSEDINKVNYKKFGELYRSTISREDIFKNNGFNVVSIWENEFKKTL